MGTRRSKHNKGRKPFYKNISRTTLADLQPAEPDRWEGEAEAFFADWRQRDLQINRVPMGAPSWSIPKQDVELTDEVKRYLDKRKQEAARKDAAMVFPETWQDAPSCVLLPSGRHNEAEQVEPSRRDILLEMFVERKLTAGQFNAGRRWQSLKEYATLQPNKSIDWSMSVGRMPYQKRGDVTAGQWGAMRHRAGFVREAGIAAATFLDVCLDADRGRNDLTRTLNVPRAQLECAIDDLLTKLCAHFARLRHG